MRKLGKSCVLIVFFFLFKIVKHGSRRGDTARALAQWWHLVALHEATDALHLVMHIVPYPPGSIAIEIVINLSAFVIIIDSVVAHDNSFTT
jgi:hypothetical protein